MKDRERNFSSRILSVVAKIPRGRVLTYQEVARRAGSSRAYRAVGNILNKNHNPKIPCHRVIRSDGAVGGYNRGVKNKLRVLRAEGVKL